MISVSVKHDLRGLTRHLNEIERKQLPFAASKAINEAGWETRKDLIDEGRKVFHQPKTWTLRQIKYIKATKRDLRAVIYIDIDADKIYPQQIHGGARAEKRYEWLLRRKGILPQGMFTVPATRLQNRAGNISASNLNKIISGLGAFTEAGFTANRTARSARKKTNRYFVSTGTGRTSHLAKGIWEITGRGGRIRPAILFIDSPTYTKRFDFYGHARRRFNVHFRAAFPRALARAVATRKR